MTTIAYDGVSLASDSQTTQGDVRLSLNAQKIFQPLDGETWAVNGERAIAFGVAGKLHSTIAVHKALSSCMSGYKGLTVDTRFPKGYSLNYLVITEDGGVYAGGQYEDDDVPWLAKVSAPIAVGSGAEFAMGAMAAGVSAKIAIGIAAQYDVGTGGKVQVIQRTESPITG